MIERLVVVDGQRYMIWARTEEEALERLENLKARLTESAEVEDGEVTL